MATKAILSLGLVCLLASCGQRPSSDDAGTKVNTGVAMPDPSLTGSAKAEKSDDLKRKGFQGFVGQCLVEASEIAPSSGEAGLVTLYQRTICSDVMGAQTREELQAKLDAWKKEHCPAEVLVQNGTKDHFEGCRVKANTALDFIVDSGASLAEPRMQLVNCGGQPGANYGSVECE